MLQQTFDPYWKTLLHDFGPDGRDEDPHSWVFYIVAKFSGVFQPMAVATSRGGPATWSLRGLPLIETCQRLITIFSTKANHKALQAEKAMAKRAGFPLQRIEQHELPEHEWTHARRSSAINDDHLKSQQPMWEFPFTSLCLLQGVRLQEEYDGEYGDDVQLKPLSTVYRDISIEWGMVVIDITDLDTVAYGIVGFHIAPMMYIRNYHDKYMSSSQKFPGWVEFPIGSLRVAESPRARRALSAAEYLAKFDPGRLTINDETNLRLLSKTSVITTSAMDYIWPVTIVNTPHPRLLPDKVQPDLPETVILETSWVVSPGSTIPSVSTDTRSIENVPEISIQNRHQISTTLASDHLSLEHLSDPISALCFQWMAEDDISRTKSISFCVDDVVDDIDQLVTILLGFRGLEELYIVSRPDRPNDGACIALHRKILATGPSSFLSKSKLVLTGLYSCAIVQGLLYNMWLTAMDLTATKTTTEFYPQ